MISADVVLGRDKILGMAKRSMKGKGWLIEIEAIDGAAE
jgi:hypothetical protein